MLTREELLVAGDHEFMNDKQLSFMKNLLIEMRQEIVSHTSPKDTLASQLQASDPLDRAQAEAQWMVNIRMRSLQTDLLNEVDQALIRVENGDYGYCELSGEPIDIRRLLAQPTCSITLEEKHRQESTPCE